MRVMEYLQRDPLKIIARSHNITLHARFLDYTSGLREEVAYRQRRFFGWGGSLAVRPMDELSYCRLVMRRERVGNTPVHAMGCDHAEAILEMREI